jgi:hypothetical protein
VARVLRALLAGSALLGACGASAGPEAPAAPSAPNQTTVGGIKYAGKLTQGGWLRGVAPPGTRAVTLDGKPLVLAPDGAFFAAFDRDAPASVQLSVTAADGFGLALPLAIAPRSWRIETVDVAKRPGTMPDAAFLARRAAELKQIGASRAQRSEAEGWRQAMIWPAAGRISGAFIAASPGPTTGVSIWRHRPARPSWLRRTAWSCWRRPTRPLRSRAIF